VKVCYCIDKKEWTNAQNWLNQLFETCKCGPGCCWPFDPFGYAQGPWDLCYETFRNVSTTLNIRNNTIHSS